MPLPIPEPGLVVCYRCLWRREHDAGFVEGKKAQPCVIVVSVMKSAGRLEVVVAPVTHMPPDSSRQAVEIPWRVKRHLGLDSERSWVVADDLNVFTWPGFDLNPVSTAEPGRFDYGFLPPRLFATIRAAIVGVQRQGMSATPRDA